MNMFKHFTLNFSLFSCVFLLFASAHICQARIFTNKKNQKINASIVSVEGEKVVLKMLKNQTDYTIDIATLSDDDQKFIQEWVAENKLDKPDTTKAKEAVSDENRGTFLDPNHPQAHLFYNGLKKKYGLQDNFHKDWPTLINTDIPEINTIKEADKEYIYESPNYRFVCDVKLSQSVVKKFAHLFESTREFCQALPITMLKAHIPSGTKKYKILLFETEQSYFKNGGPPGSAGVYMSNGDVIMVPLTSLGVKKVGSSYRYDFDGSNKTLPHEITHQLTNFEYFNPGSRGWFSEGLAEYVAMTDYRSGKFIIRGNDRDIEQFVTGFSKKSNRGRNIGTEINAPDLKHYMTMSYAEFGANGNFNYGLGALITCYFFHYEKESGRENINAFLKALNAGKQGEEALKSLLNGRTFDELEKDIFDAWKSRGVKINFR